MRLMPPASYNPAAVREASQWILTMNIDKPLLATNQNMPTHSIHHIIKLMKDSLRAPNMINRIKADKQHSYNLTIFSSRCRRPVRGSTGVWAGGGCWAQ